MGIWPSRTVAFFWVFSLLSPSNKFNESQTGLRMGPKMGTGSPPENNWCGVISTGPQSPRGFFPQADREKHEKNINSGKWENIGFSMVFPHWLLSALMIWSVIFRAKYALRIRRGKIRILIDDGSGNPVPVGPIQLSSADSIEELQRRVWLVTTWKKAVLA